MSRERVLLGATGEDAAARRYERAGYEVVGRNWRCREGELDLVLAHGRLMVFCEVKTRTSERFGLPAEAVDWRKQARIRRLAVRWLAAWDGARPGALRFDVASVSHGRVTIFEDAF